MSWDDIRRYHKEVNKWSDIGYHFGIEKIENSYEILVGRMLTEVGAHCEGHNSTSIGVCFIGDFDKTVSDKEMWDLGIRLVRSLCYVFSIPNHAVRGHNAFSEKTCPGKNFNMDTFRHDLEARNA
jgi:N-acetyl-anhydromuramyl-L-alanine amidase AmpD